MIENGKMLLLSFYVFAFLCYRTKNYFIADGFWKNAVLSSKL